MEHCYWIGSPISEDESLLGYLHAIVCFPDHIDVIISAYKKPLRFASYAAAAAAIAFIGGVIDSEIADSLVIRGGGADNGL